MLRRILTLVCFFALACSLGWGQITNVTDATSTPIPGAGHDYIKMLNETVNPAEGSVSLRICVPMPKGRRLTVPFCFAYDSSGIWHLEDGSNGALWNTNAGFLMRGGWSYTAPILSNWQKSVQTTYQNQNYTCYYDSDYVFQDPSGLRHPLGLASALGGSSPSNQGCYYHTPQIYSVTSGGDTEWLASLPSTSPSVAVAIADEDGTVYDFSTNHPISQAPSSQLTYYFPEVIEDRNRNQVILSSPTSGGQFSYTDTLGRTVFSSSGFGSTGNTINVSGLGAYTITWGIATTSAFDSQPLSYYLIQSTNPDPTAWGAERGDPNYCPFPTPRGPSGSQPVITDIELPNDQHYHFEYNGPYGMLTKVTYPTGGSIQYVWGTYNPTTYSEIGAFTDHFGVTEGCIFAWDTIALKQRIVSFDGANPALEQDFVDPNNSANPGYSTTWAPSGTYHFANPMAGWTSKTTHVKTSDLVRGVSYWTTYVYGPVGTALPPFETSFAANQIPVESSVKYYGSDGSVLRSVSKLWVESIPRGV